MVSNVFYLVALAGKLPAVINCNTGYQICSALAVIGRLAILGNFKSSVVPHITLTSAIVNILQIVVLATRSYALYESNKYVLSLFISLGITIFVLDSMHVKLVACVPTHGKNIPETLMAILVVVYEVLSAGFVTSRAFQALKIRKDIKTHAKRLDFLILQQGILYFCFVSIFTSSKLVLLYTARSDSYVQRLLNGLTLPISGLLTARFILHMREWNHKAIHGETDIKISLPIAFRHTNHQEGEEAEAGGGDSNFPSVAPSVQDEFGQDPVKEAP
ncbi:hypothetical protein D9613_008738 [Agrocybe pediades]|uniref:Uncharacterized protein n=1 Tax=Agrocybe pediades TaxID=84607 RepID=A0A8H4QSS7_9AGAR|nr:hypothetical protein D9613_008738 [Agrocybe pediades]